MTDHVARFAAKHRRVFSSMSAVAIDDIRFLVSQHVVCGHLFLQMNFSVPLPDKNKLSNDTLFNLWLPRIYMPPQEVIDERNKERELWSLWFEATGKPIYDAALRNGIKWDSRDALGTEQAIITHYHTAGMVLRYCEADFAE